MKHLILFLTLVGISISIVSLIINLTPDLNKPVAKFTVEIPGSRPSPTPTRTPQQERDEIARQIKEQKDCVANHKGKYDELYRSVCVSYGRGPKCKLEFAYEVTILKEVGCY